MKTTSPKWLYYFFAVITLTQCSIAALLLIDFIFHPLAPDPLFGSVWYRFCLALVATPIGLTVSILVLRRTPGNVTGLFLLLLLTLIVNATVREDTSIRQIASVGGLGWTGLWLLWLYFPDGRAFPPRFEPHINLLSVAFMASVILWYVATPTLGSGQSLNPIFVPALGNLFPLISALQGIILLLVAIVIVPSIISRYRKGTVQTRQQLKWLGWTFVLILLVTLPLGVTGKLTSKVQPSGIDFVLTVIFTLTVYLGPFAAVGNAILRHRLYDIDIIIRRTLIYSTLTAILAVVFFGGVMLAQSLFRTATGQSSDLAIVISTLAIAALFTPLRRRIQSAIDHRFYRRKYDAEKTLAQFSQTLRDETDLASLQASMIGVVRETMQPTHTALWINTKEGQA